MRDVTERLDGTQHFLIQRKGAVEPDEMTKFFFDRKDRPWANADVPFHGSIAQFQ